MRPASLESRQGPSVKRQGQRSLGVQVWGLRGSPGPVKASPRVLRFGRAPATHVLEDWNVWMCPFWMQALPPSAHWRGSHSSQALCGSGQIQPSARVQGARAVPCGLLLGEPKTQAPAALLPGWERHTACI